MVTYVEAELVFTFPDELQWRELDVQGIRLPNGMKLVDIVIELDDEILFVEIKDPSNSKAPNEERKRYFKRLTDNSILSDELTPKARGSYTLLHLMEQDAKPIKYIVILGLDAFKDELQKPLLSTFADRLYRSIYQEMDDPWKKKYIGECTVLSVEGWNKRFAKWPVSRVAK